jgi:hypothetical protein
LLSSAQPTSEQTRKVHSPLSCDSCADNHYEHTSFCGEAKLCAQILSKYDETRRDRGEYHQAARVIEKVSQLKSDCAGQRAVEVKNPFWVYYDQAARGLVMVSKISASVRRYKLLTAVVALFVVTSMEQSFAEVRLELKDPTTSALLVYGTISKSDGDNVVQHQADFSKVSRLRVFLNSNGGDVEVAMKIGRIIRNSEALVTTQNKYGVSAGDRRSQERSTISV